MVQILDDPNTINWMIDICNHIKISIKKQKISIYKQL